MGKENYDLCMGPVTVEVPLRHPWGEDGIMWEPLMDLESDGESKLEVYIQGTNLEIYMWKLKLWVWM